MQNTSSNYCPNCGNPAKFEANYCPNCGNQLAQGGGLGHRRFNGRTHRGDRIPWGQVTISRLQAGTAQPIPDATHYEKRYADHQANVSGEFLTPALQSLFWGILWGSLALVFLVAIEPLRPYWWVALVVFLLMTLQKWTIVSNLFNDLLQVTELIRADEPEVVELERHVLITLTPEGHQQKHNVPIDWHKFVTIARATTQGDHPRPISQGEWVRKKKGDGKLLSRAEYDTLQEWLISRQFIQWVDPNNRRAGLGYTTQGRAVVSAVARGDINHV